MEQQVYSTFYLFLSLEPKLPQVEIIIDKKK